MIKNFLYSLFLHFVLLLIIYANFHLVRFEENKSSEILVSLVSTSGASGPSQNSDGKNLMDDVAKPRQEDGNVKAKSKKQSVKNQVKSKSKALTKAEKKLLDSKPIPEEKSHEYTTKSTLEKDKHQDLVEKTRERERENRDEERNDSLRQEKDLGAEKVDEEQQATESDNNNQALSSVQNSVEDINLSPRERFNIQQQLNRCYKRAVQETGLKSGAKLMVKIQINEDGFIDSELNDVVDSNRYNNPKEKRYRIAVDNIKKAINLCSPLRNLPLDKYNLWKEVILEFDEEENVAP